MLTYHLKDFYEKRLMTTCLYQLTVFTLLATAYLLLPSQGLQVLNNGAHHRHKFKSKSESCKMSTSVPTVAEELTASKTGILEVIDDWGQRIVHISTRNDNRAGCTVNDIISGGAKISSDRASELVRLGAVYIGEETHDNHRKGRRRSRGVNSNGGKPLAPDHSTSTTTQENKDASEIKDRLHLKQVKLQQQYRLRRLGSLEGPTVPMNNSYFRVHCNPRLFPVAQSISWFARLVEVTDDYVVVDKPSGVPTTPTTDNVVDTVLYQVERILNPNHNDMPKMHAVSRLDVCTSGLVVLARNSVAASELGRLFREREISKRYLALLSPGPGVPEGEAIHCVRTRALDGSRRPKIYANHDPELLKGGKWGGCWTLAHSTILSCSPTASPAAHAAAATDHAKSGLTMGPDGGDTDGHPAHLCWLELGTGRTHQLRLQLAAMGAGIVGDTRYRSIVGRIHRGQPEDDRTDIFGQEPDAIALQAARLEFEWGSKRVVYNAKLPSWAADEPKFSGRDSYIGRNCRIGDTPQV